MEPLHLVALLLGADSADHTFGNCEEHCLANYASRGGRDVGLSLVLDECGWSSQRVPGIMPRQPSMKRTMDSKLCQGT